MGAQLARQLTEILDQTAAGIEYVFRVVIPLICLLLVALAVLLFVVVSLMFGEGVGLILLHTLLLSAGVLITVVSLAFAGGCVALLLRLQAQLLGAPPSRSVGRVGLWLARESEARRSRKHKS